MTKGTTLVEVRQAFPGIGFPVKFNSMSKNRLEAFSDGVLAILITIMVLELKVPHSEMIYDLIPLAPIFLSYVISFIYLAIYWNNHHHLFQAVHHVNGTILWANMNLLFWLSLIPFVTAWSGENHFSSLPVAAYGLVLMMSRISYFVLTRILIRHHGKQSTIAHAIGKDTKGIVSMVLYASAIVIAYWYPKISFLIYSSVAAMWFVPDSRIEKTVKTTSQG
jgi:uncharacterized membrane protein